MAKISKGEYLEKLNSYIGEETSEETLSLIEDISDSWPDDVDNKNDVGAEWERKYKELDETWKKRYRDRFFDGVEKTPGADPIPEEPKKEVVKELLTYEDFYKSIEIK